MNDLIFEVDRLSLDYPEGRGHPATERLNDSLSAWSVGTRSHLSARPVPGSRLCFAVSTVSSTVVRHGAIRRARHPIFILRELRCRVALVMQTPVMFEGTVRDNLCIRPRRPR